MAEEESLAGVLRRRNARQTVERDTGGVNALLGRLRYVVSWYSVDRMLIGR